jgi:16S rRNA (cytosine1402-N4)-methyltransferase
MVSEVLSMLRPAKGNVVVDATLGAGGHALEILPHILPGGRLVGIDRDPQILAVASERLRPFADAVWLVHASADEIDRVLASLGVSSVDGILFDLGVSSLQIDRPDRGFSFDKDGPLDMRMDPRLRRTAADLVNRESEASLATLLREYGDERFARRIARAIVQARERRPIRRTLELADLVTHALGRARASRSAIHPATRTFQALRIAVNDELGGIERALPLASQALRPGGRLVVIAFHSLEDRISKRFLSEQKKEGRLAPLTKKPLQPTEEEIARNPRSRSARLRAAERVGEPGRGEESRP